MEIRTYEKQFYKKYLPEDIYTIIELSELPKISTAIKQDTKVTGSLADFIQKLLMQFQTSKSMEQTLNMLNAQLEIRNNIIDLNYNIIRYLSWLIPTLGFIGTVVGIANALAYAGKVNGQGATFVAELTQKLALAFDTTLVALVMSAVVVFLTHIIQGKEENNLTQVGQYCLDNLINKLYIN
jgi:biopolymer transport protein ExbB/TolQ